MRRHWRKPASLATVMALVAAVTALAAPAQAAVLKPGEPSVPPAEQSVALVRAGRPGPTCAPGLASEIHVVGAATPVDAAVSVVFTDADLWFDFSSTRGVVEAHVKSKILDTRWYDSYQSYRWSDPVLGASHLSSAFFRLFFGHARPTPVASIEFCLEPAGSIEGNKFHDLDADGHRDGEPGLAGWTIVLDGSQSTVTAVDGGYGFDDVAPGPHTVCEIQVEGWFQSFPAGDGCHAVEVVAGHSEQADFGNYQKGTIEGDKFHDLDADGQRDAGEPGLEGWTIALDGVATTTTAGDGHYMFSGVQPGAHTVCEQAAEGWFQSFPAGDGCHQVDLVSGSAASGAGLDFGNYTSGSISGRKTDDASGIGLPGWTILLSGGGLTATLEATTDGDGHYTFAGLLPGAYTVCEDLPDGWNQVAPGGNGCHEEVIVVSADESAEQDFVNSPQVGEVQKLDCGETGTIGNGDGPESSLTLSDEDCDDAKVGVASTSQDGNEQTVAFIEVAPNCAALTAQFYETIEWEPFADANPETPTRVLRYQDPCADADQMAPGDVVDAESGIYRVRACVGDPAVSGPAVLPAGHTHCAVSSSWMVVGESGGTPLVAFQDNIYWVGDGRKFR